MAIKKENREGCEFIKPTHEAKFYHIGVFGVYFFHIEKSSLTYTNHSEKIPKSDVPYITSSLDL